MSNIITNAKTIHKDQWTFEPKDNKWYAVIPFECDENDDVIVSLADSDEYRLDHEDDFNALSNGFTRKNECIITASKKISCDILVEVNKAESLGGEIIYRRDQDTGNLVPEWMPDKTILDNDIYGISNEIII